MRQEVVRIARAWIDVPFKHQGRSRQDGVDCLGNVIVVVHTLDLSQFDVTGYRRYPAGVGSKSIEQVCREQMQQKDPVDMQPGDIGLFLIDKRPRHMCIFADYAHGGMSMIHSYEPAGKVVEHALDSRWLTLLCGVYQLPGVD